MSDVEQGIGYSGWCGFCGAGDGRLGEQGDERSHWMHSAVNVGTKIDRNYEYHPGSIKSRVTGELTSRILWCGNCDEGLTHRYLRYSDDNLEAMLTVYKLWHELDPPKWYLWEVTDKDRAARESDDPAIHVDKVNRQDEIALIQREWRRRQQAKLLLLK